MNVCKTFFFLLVLVLPSTATAAKQADKELAKRFKAASACKRLQPRRCEPMREINRHGPVEF